MKLVKGITKEYRFELRDENGKTILNPEEISIIIRKRPRTPNVLEKTLSGGDITWSESDRSWYFSITETDLASINLGHYGFVCVVEKDGKEKMVYKSEADVVELYTAPADDEYYPDGNDQFAIYKPVLEGGSGSDSRGEWVGNVDETKTAFPTERPDGEPLENWDFVTVDRNATLPFTIEGLEFQNPNDKAVYLGGAWQLNTSAYQNTDETPLKDKELESISGTAPMQSDMNKEVVVRNKTLSIERLGAYIYQATFDKIPEYEPLTTAVGGCSSFIRGSKLYRNLDWNYDNTAEFRVITKDFEGMAFVPGLEDGSLDYKKVAQLPYHVNDGVNRDGIMVSSHVLFNDWSYTGSGSKNKSITQLLYYILTNLHDISDINTVLDDYLANLSIPDYLVSQGYLLQFMVSDGTTTYAILPPNTTGGSYTIQDITANPKLTNFRWVSDATVVRTDLQEHPIGVERWNEIGDTTTLKDLRFTKAYEAPTRLSEFIGEGGTTKDSTDAELEAIYNTAHAIYETRTRDGQLWQTVHSVVYGANGMEHLYVQENWEKDYIASGGGEPTGSDIVNITTSFKFLGDGTRLFNFTDEDKATIVDAYEKQKLVVVHVPDGYYYPVSYALANLAVIEDGDDKQIAYSFDFNATEDYKQASYTYTGATSLTGATEDWGMTQDQNSYTINVAENTTIDGVVVPNLVYDELTYAANRLGMMPVFIQDNNLQRYYCSDYSKERDPDHTGHTIHKFSIFKKDGTEVVYRCTTHDSSIDISIIRPSEDKVVSLFLDPTESSEGQRILNFTHDDLLKVVDAYNNGKVLLIHDNEEGRTFVPWQYRVEEGTDDSTIYITLEDRRFDYHKIKRYLDYVMSLNGSFETELIVTEDSERISVADTTTVDGVEIPNMTWAEFQAVLDNGALEYSPNLFIHNGLNLYTAEMSDNMLDSVYHITISLSDGTKVIYECNATAHTVTPTVIKPGPGEKSDVGDVISSTALDTEAKVIAAKGGTAWTLLSDIDGVYQWERTA